MGYGVWVRCVYVIYCDLFAISLFHTCGSLSGAHTHTHTHTHTYTHIHIHTHTHIPMEVFLEHFESGLSAFQLCGLEVR
jgi:hypothetical protein